ncbi:MAG: phosphoribosylaminoimidazolesuccinocarboxamide synthase [Bacillota bacterium]
MSQCVLNTDFLKLPLKAKGKVRDIYDLGDHLLMIATDRVSAFDVVLPNGVPHKGQVLTKLSEFWFGKLAHIVPHHLVTTRVEEFPAELHVHHEQLRGRAMLVKKAEVVPVECVVRGYLAGSGWKEYKQSQTVCGIPLPAGLRESDQLPAPIFTPAAKNNVGHDENITFERMIEMVGQDLAAELRAISLKLYTEAADHARAHGIILADTKFEFGLIDGQITLIDEVFTPDSSRFWLLDAYQPGKSQPSLDKQFIRDYLEEIRWDKEPPAPQLPSEVIDGTVNRYLAAYRQITGRELRSDL